MSQATAAAHPTRPPSIRTQEIQAILKRNQEMMQQLQSELDKDAPIGGGAINGRPLFPKPSALAADPGPRRDDAVVPALKSQESDLSSLPSALGSKGPPAPQGVQKTTPHSATEPESVDECTESGLLLALAKASPLVSPRNSQGAPTAAAALGGHVESDPLRRGEEQYLNDAGAMPTGSENAKEVIGATDATTLDEQAIERAIADAERVHAKQVSEEEAIRRERKEAQIKIVQQTQAEPATHRQAKIDDYHAKLAEVEENLRKAREARAMQKERILEKHASMKSMTADILETDILSAAPAHKQTGGTGKTVATTLVPEPPLAAASDSQRQEAPTAPVQTQAQLLPQVTGQNTATPPSIGSVSPPPPTQTVNEGLTADATPIASDPPPTIDRGIIAPIPPVESDQPTNQTASGEAADAATSPASEPSKETAAMPPQSQQVEPAVAASDTLPVATSTPESGEESAAPKQSQEQGSNEEAVVTGELLSVSAVDVTLKLQLDTAHAGDEGSVLRTAFEKGLKRDLAIASGNRDTYFETMGVYPAATSLEVDVRIRPAALGTVSQHPAEIAQSLVSGANDPNSQLREGVYTSALESVEIVDSTALRTARMKTPRCASSIKTKSGTPVKSIADTLGAGGVAGALAKRGRPGLLFYPNAECCLVVNDAIVDTHAFGSGIEIGDLIVKVEGQSVDGQPMDVVMEMFAGPIGSDLTVTVRKHHTDKKLRFTLVRDVPYASPHPSTVELPRTLSRSLSLSRPSKGASKSAGLHKDSPVGERSKTTPTLGSQGKVRPEVDSELDDSALEQLKLEQEAAEWAAKHALEHEDLWPEDAMHADTGKTPSGNKDGSRPFKVQVDQLGGPVPHAPRTPRGEGLASPRSQIASPPGTPRDSETTDVADQKKVWGIKRALSRVSSKLLSPRG